MATVYSEAEILLWLVLCFLLPLLCVGVVLGPGFMVGFLRPF